MTRRYPPKSSAVLLLACVSFLLGCDAYERNACYSFRRTADRASAEIARCQRTQSCAVAMDELRELERYQRDAQRRCKP